MVKQALSERRRYVRAKRILSIQFKLAKGQRRGVDRSLGLSTTQDLGTGGLSFYTDREYCAGDILDLHIIMSGILDIYKGQAQVVRISRKKSGACFLAAVKFIEKEQTQKRNRKYRSVKRFRTRKRM